jgi:hypothetical protein
MGVWARATRHWERAGRLDARVRVTGARDGVQGLGRSRAGSDVRAADRAVGRMDMDVATLGGSHAVRTSSNVVLNWRAALLGLDGAGAERGVGC